MKIHLTMIDERGNGIPSLSACGRTFPAARLRELLPRNRSGFCKTCLRVRTLFWTSHGRKGRKK